MRVRCIWNAVRRLGRHGALPERTRRPRGHPYRALAIEAARVHWLRSLRGDYVDFWHITGQSLDYALAAIGLHDPALRSRLMELYFVLDAFPDVRGTLVALKASGLKTAILSNGSPSMLTRRCTARHSKISWTR